VDALKSMESLSIEEIAVALGHDHDMVQECLNALVWLGRVREAG